MNKYDKDAAFEDPVLRCDSCSSILLASDLREKGRCRECGNRKVRNLQVFNEEERQQMIDWNIDPKFIELFEVTE